MTDRWLKSADFFKKYYKLFLQIFFFSIDIFMQITHLNIYFLLFSIYYLLSFYSCQI